MAYLVQAAVAGDGYVVEEDLVEARAAGHLSQRANGHAGRAHVHQEGSQVAVPRIAGRSADNLPDVGQVGPGGPDLLAADPPAVPTHLHPDGLGPDRGQIRAGAGLAEQLAGDLLPAEQQRQPVLFLLLGAVPADGGRDHAQADGQRRIAGHLVLPGQSLEGARVGGGQAGAAELRRAGDPAVAVIPQFLPPPPDRGQGAGLLLGVRLLENADLVVPFAPDEPAIGFIGCLGIPLGQPGIGPLAELLQGRCRHGVLAWNPTSYWNATLIARAACRLFR
jgi:hypothetical protein